jgi:hypothetical protein
LVLGECAVQVDSDPAAHLTITAIFTYTRGGSP